MHSHCVSPFVPDEGMSRREQDIVDAYQMIVPLDYIPQRAYIDSNAGAGESSTKRGTAGLFAESKGSARGGKKSKHELASVPAVSLDDNDLSRYSVRVCLGERERDCDCVGLMLS